MTQSRKSTKFLLIAAAFFLILSGALFLSDYAEAWKCGASCPPTTGSPDPFTLSSISSCSPASVNLSWTASAGANGYRVNKCEGAGCAPATNISGILPTSQLSFSDANVITGTTYGYQVMGTNANGQAYTNIVYATGPNCVVPNQPPVANATISTDGISYSDSITVTRGVPTPIYLSAAGSSDPDGWSDIQDNGRCEWNNNLNQGAPIFDSTINNPVSPVACDVNSIPNPTTFNDASDTYTYQVLRIFDGTDFSNTDTVQVIVSAVPTYTLIVKSTVVSGASITGSLASAGGTANPAGYTRTFDSGTSVALTALPVAGFTFDGWSVGCTGANPCGVTMDFNKTVIANYSIVAITSLSCSVAQSAILRGESATWNANATGGTPPLTFTWTSNNAEGPSGTGNPKTVPYNQTGTKTGSVRVTDAMAQSFGPVSCNNSLTVADPECADNDDNDGDGLKNCEDPGCHTDGNPNNPLSCDPTDDDETNSTFREIFIPFRRALAMMLGI